MYNFFLVGPCITKKTLIQFWSAFRDIPLYTYECTPLKSLHLGVYNKKFYTVYT